MKRQRSERVKENLKRIDDEGMMVGELAEETSDEIAESFLLQVLACPICKAEAQRRKRRQGKSK